MALSLDDCDEMIAAANLNGIALVIGHTHSFDPAIRTMSDLIASGEVGRLSMIAMWNYTDFIYRPRRPEELDTSRGGGSVQPNSASGRHRAAAGGAPKCAGCGRWPIFSTARVPPRDPAWRCVSFADGAAASLVYSGYDRFDSDELHGWIGESGQPKSANHGSTHRALAAMHANGAGSSERGPSDTVTAAIGKWGPQPGQRWHQPHFGTLIVSCEKADLRQSADGILIYSADGVREIAVPAGNERPGRSDVLDELYGAVTDGVLPVHDGRFARGTLEVCLGDAGILEAAKRSGASGFPAAGSSGQVGTRGMGVVILGRGFV